MRLPPLRRRGELELDGVELIVAFTTTVARAVKDASKNVPIVFAAGRDPVASGFVDSMPKPGGRLTGVHFLTVELTAKRLGLLREMCRRSVVLSRFITQQIMWLGTL
jgi:putative ABC transport system substrate-binding protein